MTGSSANVQKIIGLNPYSKQMSPPNKLILGYVGRSGLLPVLLNSLVTSHVSLLRKSHNSFNNLHYIPLHFSEIKAVGNTGELNSD